MLDVNSDGFWIRFGKPENQIGETAVFLAGFIAANPAVDQFGEIQELKRLKSGRSGVDYIFRIVHGWFS
jgi:hypothetical protein